MISSIRNGALEISVDTRGAELTGLISLSDRMERLWQADPKIWPRHAPILFPIVGKLENDQCKIGTDVYTLSQHGFARDCEFKLLDRQPDRLLYQLSSDEQTLKKYPYRFELNVRYELRNNDLNIEYLVRNIDRQTIWFSIGAHPGFNCPFRPGEMLSDYSLEFDKPENAARHFLEDGVFSGKTERILNNTRLLPLTQDLFDHDAVIFKNLRSKKVALKSKNGAAGISVAFDGFPYLGIWSKPGAHFVCIEPWCGVADTKGRGGDFRKKEGIISLDPDKMFTCNYTISVE